MQEPRACFDHSRFLWPGLHTLPHDSFFGVVAIQDLFGYNTDIEEVEL